MSSAKQSHSLDREPAQVMRELRFETLTTLRVKMGWTSGPEFPRVCGVVMDWPLQGAVVSAVALRSGDASIYTTGTFGVLGGIGHERIRSAAGSVLKTAEKWFEASVPTTGFDYPTAGRVNFFIIGYEGTRMLQADLAELSRGTGDCVELYVQSQRLISELRLISGG